MIPQVHNRTADADGDGIDSAAETLDLDSDDEAQHNQSNRSGFTFVPAESLDGLECRISEKSEGLVTAYLTTDSGTVLERQTVASVDPGGSFTFETALEANESYQILCDAQGRNYVRGRAEVEYPLENDLFTVTHGIYTGSGLESDSYRYCIDRIGPIREREREGSIDLGSDDEGQSWRSLTGRSGIRIQTTEAVDGLECRLSERSENLITAYLTTDSGSVLERQTIGAFDAGDSFAFEATLEADETYRVVCDARGRSYVRGRAEVDYPLESGPLSVTDGIYGDGERSDSYRYCFDRIAPGDTGTVPDTGYESESESETDDPETDTLDLGSDEEGQAWSSLDEPSGVRFRVDEAVGDVTCRLSSETDGVTTAVLTDDGGDVLDEQSVDDLGAGDTFAFAADLEAGETYGILLDADGESYVRGRAAADYPLESAVLEAVHGIYSGDYESESYRYCVDRITVSIADSEPSEPEESEPEEPGSAESTIDLGDDEEGQSWGSLDQPSGVRFRAEEDLSRVTGRLSAETDDVTTATLTDDDGDPLEERSIDDLEGGETFSFEADLEAGETYWVVCDADGESYTRGRAEADYPLEDDLLSVTDGIYGGYLETDSYRYCLDRLSVESTGSGGYETETEETELDLGSDEEGQSWSTLDRRSGVRFRTEEDLSTVTGRLSAETDGVTTAALTDDSGSVLEEQSVDDLEPGDTFAFDIGLEADEAYHILLDADGESYVRGRAEADYPLEDDLLAVTHGIYGGEYESESYRYCVERIGAEREYEVPIEDDEESESEPESEPEIETIDLGDDEEGQSRDSLDSPSGVRIRASDDLDRLECRLSAETEGVTTAYLTTDDVTTATPSEDDILDEQSIADLEAGDTFAFDVDLEADDVCWVVCDAAGDTYVRGRAGADYPIDGGLLEVTDGIYGGYVQSEDYRYCLDRIVVEGGSASSDETESEPTEPEVPALELGDDEEGQSWSSLDDRSGVRLVATESVDALECRLSAETDGVTTAYLTDDGGDVLDERSIGDLEAGDSFVLNGELEADEAYSVLLDADGESYVRGRTAIEYPIESDFLEATHGIYGGDYESESYRYCLERIEPTEPEEHEPEPESASAPSGATHGLLAEVKRRPDDVTTVNVVDEPSIDEDGDLSAEILAYLDSQSVVNHEIVIPTGTYRWNTEFYVTDPVEYIEIRGDLRATLEIRDEDVDFAFGFGTWDDSDPPQHVVVRNIDVDIDDRDERDASLITAHVGRCLIDNVELIGQRMPYGPEGGVRYSCLINTLGENALSLIRNVTIPDGDIANPDLQPVGNHSIGISADPPHDGINIWQQCFVEKTVGNGFYVRNSPGENILNRCVAANCGSGNIRLGSGDTARDCKIFLDEGSEQLYPGAALWLNGGQPIAERIEIDGSDAQNDILRVNGDADGGHVKGLDLFCGANVESPAIRCTETSSTDPRGLLIEDFDVEDITTSGGGSVQIRRPDVTFKNGVIDASYRSAFTGSSDPDLENVDIL